MLTPEEIAEIEKEISHYEHKAAAGIDALKIVQRRNGWVSDELLKEVADFLDMSHAELDSVATFYSRIFRRPVGRHVIFVCDSIACWVMGYEELIAELKKRLQIGLGETTKDGRFTLLPHVCLGICHHAPALMIDDDLYEDADASKIDNILASYS